MGFGNFECHLELDCFYGNCYGIAYHVGFFSIVGALEDISMVGVRQQWEKQCMPFLIVIYQV